jgi:hypothetical protein
MTGLELPAARVVVMEVVSSGKGDSPEADDEGSDSKDPFTDRAVLGTEGAGFADTEDLAAKADGHEENAEDEGEPNHNVTFVP